MAILGPRTIISAVSCNGGGRFLRGLFVGGSLLVMFKLKGYFQACDAVCMNFFEIPHKGPVGYTELL